MNVTGTKLQGFISVHSRVSVCPCVRAQFGITTLQLRFKIWPGELKLRLESVCLCLWKRVGKGRVEKGGLEKGRYN